MWRTDFSKLTGKCAGLRKTTEPSRLPPPHGPDSPSTTVGCTHRPGVSRRIISLTHGRPVGSALFSPASLPPTLPSFPGSPTCMRTSRDSSLSLPAADPVSMRRCLSPAGIYHPRGDRGEVTFPSSFVGMNVAVNAKISRPLTGDNPETPEGSRAEAHALLRGRDGTRTPQRRIYSEDAPLVGSAPWSQGGRIATSTGAHTAATLTDCGNCLRRLGTPRSGPPLAPGERQRARHPHPLGLLNLGWVVSVSPRSAQQGWLLKIRFAKDE